MPRGMAGRRHEANPGRDLELSVDEHHQTGVAQRLDTVPQVRPLLQRLLRHEVRPVVRRHHIAGIRKRAIPAHVIDVQMRVHDEIDLGRTRADSRELLV